MHRVHSFGFLACVLMALALFAACSGGDDKNVAGTEEALATGAASASASGAATGVGSRSAVTPEGGSPTSEAASPEASPSSTAAASPTPGDVGSLRDAVKDTSQMTYSVKYDVVSRSDNGERSLRYTAVNKPPSSSVRIEDVAEGEAYVSVNDAEFKYFCIEAEKACFKTKLEQDDLANDILPTFDPDEVVDNAEEDGATAVELASRNIAGREARCWEVTDPSGTGVLCLDKETGVTLLVDGDFNGEDSKFEATEFTTSVSEDAFTVPSDYKIEDLEELGSDSSDTG